MRAPKPHRSFGGNLAGAVLTPMIDVIFLLLIFFLCTSSFEEPEENLATSLIVASNAPGAGATTTEPPELEDVKLIGEVQGEKVVWTLNGSRSTADLAELTALLSELAAIDRGLPMTIDCGPDVPMGAAVGAYDAARAAGFGRVLLAADALPAQETSP